MDISALIVFAALIIVTIGMVKQSWFVRYLPLEGGNMTTGILSAALKQSAGHCASFCVELINCRSFVYNPESKECQLLNMVFTSTGSSKYQPGHPYHYMFKGISGWCPLNDGYQLLARDALTLCVKFHVDLMSWHKANESCSAYSPNSRLVVVDTKEKNDLVKAAGIAINNTFKHFVSMGLSEREDNVYSWVDGRDVIFTDWDDYARGAIGREDCVHFHRRRSWRWGRWDCKTVGHRVCEIAQP